MRRIIPIDEKGFTFLNALFDLLLLLTLLPLIVLFFTFASSFSEDLDKKHLEWLLFTEDLQSYLYQSDSIEIINNGGGVRIVQKGIEYDIEVYGKFIRKQKNDQGHEIMLTDLDSFRFRLEESSLDIQADFSSGVSVQGEYAITGP